MSSFVKNTVYLKQRENSSSSSGKIGGNDGEVP
jgi:hypothetical protein